MLGRVVLAVMALWIWAFAPGSADALPVKRDVVVIFDSEREPTPTHTQVHMRAEFPLNHLGYRLVYRDIRQGLPDDETMSSAAAVLTWFHYEIDGFETYFVWLNRMSDRGLKVIILGSLGALSRQRPCGLPTASSPRWASGSQGSLCPLLSMYRSQRLTAN